MNLPNQFDSHRAGLGDWKRGSLSNFQLHDFLKNFDMTHKFSMLNGGHLFVLLLMYIKLYFLVN